MHFFITNKTFPSFFSKNCKILHFKQNLSSFQKLLKIISPFFYRARIECFFIFGNNIAVDPHAENSLMSYRTNVRYLVYCCQRFLVALLCRNDIAESTSILLLYFLRAHSGLCNRKKRKKQAVLNIKNGETISFYKNFFQKFKQLLKVVHTDKGEKVFS